MAKLDQNWQSRDLSLISSDSSQLITGSFNNEPGDYFRLHIYGRQSYVNTFYSTHNDFLIIN